jgi:hypothetical protein
MNFCSLWFAQVNNYPTVVIIYDRCASLVSAIDHPDSGAKHGILSQWAQITNKY